MTSQATKPCPLVLVVDDDITTRLLAREALEQSGLSVEEAENGLQGLDLYQRLRPDIVLMDVMMPEMDGFGACAGIRCLPEGGFTPVLFMTGLDDEESIVRAYHAGATDFLTKPWNALVLSQRVRYMLRASAAFEALHESQKRLAQAQRIAQLGNWMWHISQDTIEVSQEVYRILGVEPRDFGGTRKAYLEYVHPQDRDRVTSAFDDLVSGGTPLSLDHRIVRPDGTERVVHEQAGAEYDLGGASQRLIGTIQDVTEQKRKEQALAQASQVMEWQNAELAKARDKALAAAKLKDEFLANISHELLTPMNGLLGMTGLLSDTELSADQREYVETIKGSGENLFALIKDVLDFSKMETDGLRLEEVGFDLRKAIDEAVKPFARQAEQKGIAFLCEVRPDVPASVHGDAGRLCQILTNLLSNAIKFTERGRISVAVIMLRESSDSTVLRFEVADTGVGIPHDARERLFQLFTQIDGSATRKHGGAGLGLVLSKRLAEAMGGLIGMESEPGRGSMFWFTVKLSRPALSS